MAEYSETNGPVSSRAKKLTTEKRLEAMSEQIRHLELRNKRLADEIVGLTQMLGDYAQATRNAVTSAETKIQNWFSVLNDQVGNQLNDMSHMLLKIHAKQGVVDQLAERMGNTNPNSGQSPLWHMQFGGQNPLGYGNPGFHQFQPRQHSGGDRLRMNPFITTGPGRPVHPGVNEESMGTYDLLTNIANQLFHFYRADNRLIDSGYVSFTIKDDKPVLDWAPITPSVNDHHPPLYVQIGAIAQQLASTLGRNVTKPIYLKTMDWDGAGSVSEGYVPLTGCDDLVNWIRSKLNSTGFGHFTKSYAESHKKDDGIAFTGFLGGVDVSPLLSEKFQNKTFNDIYFVMKNDGVHINQYHVKGKLLTASDLYNKLAEWYNQLPESEKLEKAQTARYWLVYGTQSLPAARQQLKSLEMLVNWAVAD